MGHDPRFHTECNQEQHDVLCSRYTRRGVFLNFVPLKVTAPNGKVIHIYALLVDSGSMIHLCDRRLLQALGVDGRPKNIALATVTCDLQKHNSVSVDFAILVLPREGSVLLNDLLSVTNIPAMQFQHVSYGI